MAATHLIQLTAELVVEDEHVPLMHIFAHGLFSQHIATLHKCQRLQVALEVDRGDVSDCLNLAVAQTVRIVEQHENAHLQKQT